MARVKDNILLKNVSGTIGKQMNVFNRYGETYLRTTKKKQQVQFSAMQIQSQHNFTDAVVYSKQVIKDPEMNLYYLSLARKGQSAFNVAMKDALSAPVISLIDADAYTGESGQVISIRAVDFFRVYQVNVEIIDVAGKVIEKGAAVQQWKPMYWDYTTTVVMDMKQVEKIQVTAADMPGNQTKAILAFTDG
ncbi:hypothetical protein SAMN05428949_0054 [Chitinophaga sp. YR627]|uniref:hypothetical protein n=1 Tax=Chitinophaga sp. YR627 TaxID=1881041 RepID=UPI0008E42B50|nr:hypothetical protein [Chitinophaga sp. YR627]SFM58110.1 hypothetical protein SAMN05428949_0054 [Chitinophaga sp. YR627]